MAKHLKKIEVAELGKKKAKTKVSVCTPIGEPKHYSKCTFCGENGVTIEWSHSRYESHWSETVSHKYCVDCLNKVLDQISQGLIASRLELTVLTGSPADDIREEIKPDNKLKAFIKEAVLEALIEAK